MSEKEYLGRLHSILAYAIQQAEAARVLLSRQEVDGMVEIQAHDWREIVALAVDIETHMPARLYYSCKLQPAKVGKAVKP